MPETRTIVRVFLASPGDLQPEREAVRAEIEDINENWSATVDCHFELLGWEDVSPGYGRPQSIINADVDKCDLFIGLLWKRWGTPPDTKGDFTSGFHEEYKRALASCQRTGSPDIALFLKGIPDDQKMDAGPELQKVLNFRSEVERERSVLFKLFQDVDDIRQLLRHKIASFVKDAQLHGGQPISEPEAASRSEEERLLDDSHDTSFIDSSLSPHGLQFLSEFIERVSGEGGLESLSSFDVARFRLLASSIKKQGNDSTFVGVHDANILYSGRDDADFSSREVRTLLQVGLQQYTNENVPVWRWFKALGSNADRFLVIASCVDEPVEQQLGAILLLAAAGIQLLEQGAIPRDAVLDIWLSEESPARVRNLGLKYLGLHGFEGDIERVRGEYERNSNETSRTALEVLAKLYRRFRPFGAAERMLIETSFTSLDSENLEKTVSALDRLENKLLKTAIEHPHGRIRAGSIAVLAERGKLDPERVEHLLEDPEASIRCSAVKLMELSGHVFSSHEANAYIVKKKKGVGLRSAFGVNNPEIDGIPEFERYEFCRLCGLNEQDVNREVREAEVGVIEPYLARAFQFFRKYGDKLRRDIDDGFDSYVEETIRAEEVANGQAYREAIKRRLSDLVPFIKKEFTRKGLDILCSKSRVEDIRLVRRKLESLSGVSSKPIMEYVGRYGAKEDVEIVSSRESRRVTPFPLVGDGGADDDRVEEQILADVACRLWRGQESDLILRNLETGVLVQIVKRLPRRAVRELNDVACGELLNHSADGVRKEAAIRIGADWRKKDTSKCLASYLGREEGHYYNVVHWLDLAVSIPKDDMSALLKRIDKFQ